MTTTHAAHTCCNCGRSVGYTGTLLHYRGRKLVRCLECQTKIMAKYRAAMAKKKREESHG